MVCRYKPGDFIRDGWVFLAETLMHVCANAALPDALTEELRAIIASLVSMLGFLLFNWGKVVGRCFGVSENCCFVGKGFVMLLLQCLVILVASAGIELLARYGLQQADTAEEIEEQLSTLAGASTAGLTTILSVLYNQRHQYQAPKNAPTQPRQSRFYKLIQLWTQGTVTDASGQALTQPLLSHAPAVIKNS